MKIEKDKQGHFVVGALIGFIMSFIHPLVGVLSAGFAGWFKEQLDKRDPENHTYDLFDMHWTWAGGIIGVLAFAAIKEFL